MERYKKISFKLPEGMTYSASRKGNELVFELIPDEKHTIHEVDITLERKEALEIEDVVIDTNKDKSKYFQKVTHQDRNMVRNQVKQWKTKNKKEVKFLKEVEKAIQKIDYEYWIATIEPSVENANISYASNEKVGIEISCILWEKLAESYAPKRGSRLANLSELFLWYAVRISKGYWTIDEVVNDSSGFGNYRNAPKPNQGIDRTSKRACGGFCDGQGNTYKLVKDDKHFLLVGGCYYCYGNAYPVACVHNSTSPCCTQKYSVGVVVLTQ